MHVEKCSEMTTTAPGVANAAHISGVSQCGGYSKGRSGALDFRS